MILPNGFSSRCKVTVEIPNLYLSPLWSLVISLRYKPLSHRFRYTIDTKILAYRELNISTHAQKNAFSQPTDSYAENNYQSSPRLEQHLTELQAPPVWI